MASIENVEEVPQGIVSCDNVKIQSQQLKKLRVGRSKLEGAGYGLFAGEKIQVGDFITQYVGEILTEDENERRMVMDEFVEQGYIYSTADLFIDARYKGNKARFINHSSHGDENCYYKVIKVGKEPRIGIFAAQSILPGTELLINYNYGKMGFDWYQKYERRVMNTKKGKKKWKKMRKQKIIK